MEVRQIMYTRKDIKGLPKALLDRFQNSNFDFDKLKMKDKMVLVKMCVNREFSTEKEIALRLSKLRKDCIVEYMVREGLMEEKGNKIRLTPKGRKIGQSLK